MLVREVMSSPVVTVDAEATLRTAVAAMLDRGVGSVVLVDDDQSPVAIVTDTDVLAATHDRGEPLTAIPARAAASSPLETVAPDRTVGDALQRMAGADVTHLPVVDALDVVGIVTLTDVARSYDALREEAQSLARRREEWTTDGA